MGANPRSSRSATKRTPSVKSSTADGPCWASLAPGPPKTAPASRGSPRVPCTTDDCTAVADKFPGAVAPLAPEGSGYPSFWNVLIIETILVGGAEAYRTGMVDPVFDELSVGDVSPGGRFDPLSLAESGDLEELKIKELKHCRLSMFAWLGCIIKPWPPKKVRSPTGPRTPRTRFTPTS